MRLTQTNNISDSSESGDGLLSRLGRWFRRSSRQREPVLVKVWDSRRGQYREVDLDNREDPLWFAAKSLAGVQHGLTGRSAA